MSKKTLPVLTKKASANMRADSGGENNRIPVVFHLFCNSGFVAASDELEKLRTLGELRCRCGVSDGYTVVSLSRLIPTAYVI